MGLFNFFKRKDSTEPERSAASSKVVIQGPRYLRPYLKTPDADAADRFRIKDPDIEWVGQLVSTTQNQQFSIRYHGNLMNEETIVADKDVAQKVVAVDIHSNEEILLFDKALHGWDGFIAGAYEENRSLERPTNKTYVSRKGTGNFRILFVAYYNAGTRQELLDEADADGVIEVNGTKLSLQDAFDDAFDALVIYIIDEHGNKFQLINEELA